MKVRAVIDFRDRENGLRLREKGAVFDVDERRAEKLIGLGYVERVEEDTGITSRNLNEWDSN